MKRVFIIAIILCLLIPIFTMADKKYKEFDLLTNVLSDLGGESFQADIVTNGIILDRFIERKEMEQLGGEILLKLGILGSEVDPLIAGNSASKNTYTKEVIYESDYSQIIYSGYDDNDNIVSIFLSSYIYEGKLGETYLCINVIKDGDFSGINDIIEDIDLVFEKYDASMEMISCIIGLLEGHYSRDHITANINKALKAIKGSIIEEFSDGWVSSYTIYTPSINKYLTIDKKKINLNLAIRYNEYEDNTYLWIGTPIITTGY